MTSFPAGGKLELSYSRANIHRRLSHPFGPEILKQLLDRLERPIGTTSRDVRIILMFPENAFLFEERQQFRIYKKSRRFLIYRRSATTPTDSAAIDQNQQCSSASPR